MILVCGRLANGFFFLQIFRIGSNLCAAQSRNCQQHGGVVRAAAQHQNRNSRRQLPGAAQHQATAGISALAGAPSLRASAALVQATTAAANTRRQCRTVGQSVRTLCRRHATTLCGQRQATNGGKRNSSTALSHTANVSVATTTDAIRRTIGAGTTTAAAAGCHIKTTGRNHGSSGEEKKIAMNVEDEQRKTTHSDFISKVCQ